MYTLQFHAILYSLFFFNAQLAISFSLIAIKLTLSTCFAQCICFCLLVNAKPLLHLCFYCRSFRELLIFKLFSVC